MFNFDLAYRCIAGAQAHCDAISNLDLDHQDMRDSRAGNGFVAYVIILIMYL